MFEELDEEETEDLQSPTDLDDTSELEFCIKQASKQNTSTSQDYKKSLNKEMLAFEATGILTSNLEKLKNALMTISPTSVPCERAFSVTGRFQLAKRTKKIARCSMSAGWET